MLKKEEEEEISYLNLKDKHVFCSNFSCQPQTLVHIFHTVCSCIFCYKSINLTVYMVFELLIILIIKKELLIILSSINIRHIARSFYSPVLCSLCFWHLPKSQLCFNSQRHPTREILHKNNYKSGVPRCNLILHP